MKKLKITAIALTILAFTSCKQNETKTDTETTVTTVADVIEEPTTTDFKITPISHASTVIEWDDKVMYVDPVGQPEAYADHKNPDVILITDIHGDHLNPKTLEGLSIDKATFMVPQAVADKMPETLKEKAKLMIINNDEVKELEGFSITAVPMYNLRKEDLNKHVKGRGNGYVIEKEGKRVYFSGDTEDIPEMRQLKNIDMAFVCMNLPYTMTVDSAADAVLEFKPKQVYPYHYRGQDGLSDVVKFKELVNTGDKNIEVIQLDWYPSI